MAHYEVDEREVDKREIAERAIAEREIDLRAVESRAVGDDVADGQTAATLLAHNAQVSQQANIEVGNPLLTSVSSGRTDEKSLLDDPLPDEILSTEPMSIDSMRVEVQARRWTTRVIALLLAGQAFILLAIIWVTVSQLNWAQQFRYVMLSMTVMDTLLLGGLLLPMAIFNFFTAMGLWLGQRSAWLRAMTSQGILLIFCLSSYVADRGERFIYMLMLTCIILVLYLNTYDVRLAFNSRESKN